MSPDYIAGIFDGEGFFTMRRCGTVGRKYTVREFRFQCYASILMKEEKLLKEIQNFLGYGWVSQSTKETKNHCAYYIFNITGKSLKIFCIEIGPILKIKNKQAKLILQVQNLKEKIGNKPVSDKDYNTQVTIWDKMKILNHRGPHKSNIKFN